MCKRDLKSCVKETYNVCEEETLEKDIDTQTEASECQKRSVGDLNTCVKKT